MRHPPCQPQAGQQQATLPNKALAPGTCARSVGGTSRDQWPANGAWHELVATGMLDSPCIAKKGRRRRTLTCPSRPADTMWGCALASGATTTLVAVFWCAAMRCMSCPLCSMSQTHRSVPPAVTSRDPAEQRHSRRPKQAAGVVQHGTIHGSPAGKKATDSTGAPWFTLSRQRCCRASHSLQIWSYLCQRQLESRRPSEKKMRCMHSHSLTSSQMQAAWDEARSLPAGGPHVCADWAAGG